MIFLCKFIVLTTRNKMHFFIEVTVPSTFGYGVFYEFIPDSQSYVLVCTIVFTCASRLNMAAVKMFRSCFNLSRIHSKSISSTKVFKVDKPNYLLFQRNFYSSRPAPQKE